METQWEKALACANRCECCGKELGKKAERILSVFNHRPICMTCKQAEEKKPDYEDRCKRMIAECIGATGRPYGDPRGYCFHHFCPFKCRD